MQKAIIFTVLATFLGLIFSTFSPNLLEQGRNIVMQKDNLL